MVITDYRKQNIFFSLKLINFNEYTPIGTCRLYRNVSYTRFILDVCLVIFYGIQLSSIG